MTRAHLIIAATAALLLAAGQAPAAPMDAFGELDLGTMMDGVRATWNLSRLDAVVLLDETLVSIHEDGSRTDRVHTIVWISTELALEDYGDLRVPWNSNTSELNVLSLRTWRDDRWWPDESNVSETAVVPTLPSAVRSADDYTGMRETMLLHDGIELPCIVETAYEIARRPWDVPAETGQTAADRRGRVGEYGMWTFPKSDPCVISRLVVEVPASVELKFDSANGAPDPASVRSDEHGVRFTWEMRNQGRRPHPPIADPASIVSNVVWSTWPDWAHLGELVLDDFAAAATLSQALKDSVASLVEREPLEWSAAEAIARFVGETTRAVKYPDSFWEFAPRTAERTWETAYGHRLDRAVLASALFREAGLLTWPVFRSRGLSGSLSPELPSLSRYEDVSLLVDADGLEAVYDPISSTLTPAPEALAQRVAWVPGRQPEVGETVGHRGMLELTLTLGPSEDRWTGSGVLRATNTLSPQGSMMGLAGESEDVLGALTSSTLEGADMSEWSPLEFSPQGVVCGFAVEMAEPEPDDSGRLHFRLGSPSSGVMGALPAGVHLYASDRHSPVMLPSPVAQTVTLHLDPGDREVVERPENVSMENKAGSFDLSVTDHNDGTLTITRTLRLSSDYYSGSEWPELRALLLAETNERNGTLLLR